MANKKRKWSDQELKNATKTSFSYRHVLLKLGLREAGGNFDQIKKYIREGSLDVRHFKGRGWNAGLNGIGKPRLILEQILTKNSYYQSFKLKRRLFAADLKLPRCENCGWAEKTKDGYLPL